MYNIDDVAENIYQSVVNDTKIYCHDSIIVVGDNRSGKTTLLSSLLGKIAENNNDFYFIDSPNRVVYGSEVKNQESEIRFSDFSPWDILKERKSKSFMSKEDIFPKGNKGYLVTYSELSGNTKEYEKIFNSFFKCKIERKSLLGEDSFISGNSILAINNTYIDNLSSSEAAQIRIIMETEYAKQCECKMVIIDEFCNSLDPDNQVDFASKLKDNYPELRFVFVIHDFSLLVRLSGFDAVIYNNANTSPVPISMLDCNDIKSIGEVNRIRSRFISDIDEYQKFFAHCISEYFKTGKMSDESKEHLNEIKPETLTIRNHILYDYLMEQCNECLHENSI